MPLWLYIKGFIELPINFSVKIARKNRCLGIPAILQQRIFRWCTLLYSVYHKYHRLFVQSSFTLEVSDAIRKKKYPYCLIHYSSHVTTTLYPWRSSKKNCSVSKNMHSVAFSFLVFIILFININETFRRYLFALPTITSEWFHTYNNDKLLPKKLVWYTIESLLFDLCISSFLDDLIKVNGIPHVPSCCLPTSR